MILSNLIRSLEIDLNAAKIEDARLLSERVVMDVLNVDRSFLFLNKEMNIHQENIDKIEKIKLRLLAHEPLTKILGKAYFWKDAFMISEDVLDPRADSEVLIELILKKNTINNCNILDLGTGSGCLLISLLKEYPKAIGLGLELSEAACAIAKRNIALHNLNDRGKIIHADWQAYDFKDEKYDIVISNPPYIALAEKGALSPSVLAYDPHMALFAPEDGLKNYRDIAGFLGDILAQDGLAIFEFGYSQALQVKEIFEDSGFIIEGIYQDLGGRDRAIIVKHKHK
jgi:release factor glutamine methyltransferase